MLFSSLFIVITGQENIVYPLIGLFVLVLLSLAGYWFTLFITTLVI
ncbi:MAG: hypothetical protein DRG20_00655 [Deltaproteobacteria bacterium]|nr:MAG: hypothetical protein DRG20_00655 [Deltaproteobacteria bacterium]